MLLRNFLFFFQCKIDLHFSLDLKLNLYRYSHRLTALLCHFLARVFMTKKFPLRYHIYFDMRVFTGIYSV